MKDGIFEKVLATAVVITGLVVIEKKLEEVAFKGLNNFLKDKEEPGLDPESKE